MSNAVIVEERGSAIIVRFNRPENRSPLSIEVLERLSEIIGDVEGRRDVEPLIFTGVGNIFAAGADLREIAQLSSGDVHAFARRGQNVLNRIAELGVPTIAAINGVCFGGALDLALACERRVASNDAVFSHPGANLGIITGWGGTQRLPRLIGEANALEMFFTARRVTAAAALRMRLIDEISADVVEAALQTANAQPT
ncbi:MAG TPA: enoyl-CoA hydratase/isomerase family protein [Pyrinomonadaceae bacterium]|nr:enoyl-CoA hydratase/isomerase family protein [Pyrinomonadaceae bacterium]